MVQTCNGFRFVVILRIVMRRTVELWFRLVVILMTVILMSVILRTVI